MFLHCHYGRKTEAMLEELGVPQLLVCAAVQQLHRLVCEIQRLPEILQDSCSREAASLCQDSQQASAGRSKAYSA